MFYDVFSSLCLKKGVSANKACLDIGVSRTSTAKWKSGAVPNGVTLAKMSDYFGVSTDYLLGTEQKEKAPALTKKDERDIAKDMERLRQSLETGDGLMFDGDPLSDEAKESILAAMKMGLEIAKVKNKEKYTQKKYRKETGND